MPLLETVTVTLSGGPLPDLDVTGYALRGAPGLAVTPGRIDQSEVSQIYYCVTHIHSGRRIGERYTLVDAINLMADLHALDIDWTLPEKAFGKGGIPYRAVSEIVNRYQTTWDEED